MSRSRMQSRMEESAVEHLHLETARLRITVDRGTGALTQAEHRSADLSLIGDPDRAAQHPFMVILADGEILRDWRSCSVEEASGNSILLRWELDHGLILRVSWREAENSSDLHC